MADAEKLRDEMRNNHNELKEQNREQKEQNLQLTQMITNLVSSQSKASEETTKRLDTFEETQINIIKRLEKVEIRAQQKENTLTEGYT